MEELSATEAARRFSGVLDAIEHGGESFVITRHGRPVARLGPAAGTSGKDLRAFLRKHPPDPGWPDDLRRVRELIVLQEPRWPG